MNKVKLLYEVKQYGKERKNTRKRSLIIDIVLLAIMLIVSVISFYIAYTFGLIPMKWITIFAVCCRM